MSRALSKADVEEIAEHGITQAEAERQLAILERPPVFLDIDRPCVAGDGLRVLTVDESDYYLAVFEAQAGARGLLKFVPASGAASRMFKTTEAYRRRQDPLAMADLRGRARSGDSEARELVDSFENLERFAFYRDLRDALRADGSDIEQIRTQGDLRLILSKLLAKPGLGYAGLPKALLAFHDYGQHSRTAFEEHLVEAAGYVRDRNGLCRLHFTVSPEHRPLFEGALARVRERYERAYDVKFDVQFSLQKASTDSIALTPEGDIFRTADGRVLFRPGGHGALIRNLQDLAGDIVLVKNIDNVVPDHLKPTTFRWKRILVGMAIALQAEAFDWMDKLRANSADDEVVSGALGFLADSLNTRVPPDLAGSDSTARRSFALGKLDRPLRICGMVRNEGEPGGGPFWVRSGGTSSVQIVESSQLDPDRQDQHRIFATSTHFNPVDLVCSIRDASGSAYDLSRFIDEDTSFVVEKSSEGRRLRSLERPGLWNGAMAYWNTVFVEVPAETFNPVKTMNDLLRPAHQPFG